MESIRSHFRSHWHQHTRMPSNTFFNPLYAPPISQLPVELLDAIFVFSLPQDPRFTLADDSLKPSRVVSQVCLLWRNVALSNSRLWNEITLSKWRKKDRLPWIEELLHRSRKATVSLRLWVGDGWDEQWDRMFEPLLLSLISRLRVLDVRMDYSLLCEASKLIETLSANHTPLLESISISPYNTGTWHSPTQQRHLDFLFTSSMPKLRRVEYELNFDYLPPSSLANITYFKLTSFSRYGNPNLSPNRCLELLRSMPLLEELYLSIEFEDANGSDDSLEVIFLHLKHFNIYGWCKHCAMLIPWITVPPGCTLDITCIDAEVDDAHEVVRLSMDNFVHESAIEMSDKTLEIDIRLDTLRILVHPLPISGMKMRPLLAFTTKLKHPDADSDVEEGSNAESSSVNTPGLESIHYALLILVVRTIHRMELTQAAEISLNIEVPLPIERFSAPVLGPLIRACKSAKRLRLTGSGNGFMAPFLLNMMYGTGRGFDELLFSNLDVNDGSEEDWTPAALLESALQLDLSFILMQSKPITPNPSLLQSQMLKTVSFLHTDFDVTTVEGQRMLSDFLCWREQQTKVIDNLLWPVPCPKTVHDGGFEAIFATPLTIMMADMIHHYLKPTCAQGQTT